MTTIAWDGKMMASDSLAVDRWGLKFDIPDKINVGIDFLVGAAGEHGQITKWWRSVSHLPAKMVLEIGYTDFHPETNDPAILLVTNSGLYSHHSGIFTPHDRVQHAVGSGRDFALAAMRCGLPADEAVSIAMEFDNGTGGYILAHHLPNAPAAASKPD